MANPILPGVPREEQNLLYAKLSVYNQGRESFKEGGAYLVVLPRPGHDNFSLWLFAPHLERMPILFLHELSGDINESLRMASTMFYFSRRPLLIVEYSEKRMRSNGNDILAFGKYHGHYLHEILKIDPAYLSWLAYKYTPRIPKQERFVKIAQAYHSVHLDLMLRKARQKQESSRFLGRQKETVENLTLKVVRVKVEDNPYKTRVIGTTVHFYVRQLITLVDPGGNLVQFTVNSNNPSSESCCLSAFDHEFRTGEIVHIASARVARTYESNGSKYTRLSHVKLQTNY